MQESLLMAPGCSSPGFHSRAQSQGIQGPLSSDASLPSQPHFSLQTVPCCQNIPSNIPVFAHYISFADEGDDRFWEIKTSVQVSHKLEDPGLMSSLNLHSLISEMHITAPTLWLANKRSTAECLPHGRLNISTPHDVHPFDLSLKGHCLLMLSTHSQPTVS